MTRRENMIGENDGPMSGDDERESCTYVMVSKLLP